MDRRGFLAGSTAVLGAATAGCGFILGDEPLAFEAEAARVQASTADGAGYDFDGITDQTIERTFEVAGQTREVVVTNRMAEYEKQVDLGPLGDLRAAVFTALSTPQVSVLGETFNPVARMSTAELAELLQDRFEGIESLERDGESTVSILGAETTQTRFTGQTELAAGGRIDIYLHVSEPVEHESDLIIAVGGYPQRLPGEESNVLAMMAGIEHPTT